MAIGRVIGDCRGTSSSQMRLQESLLAFVHALISASIKGLDKSPPLDLLGK